MSFDAFRIGTTYADVAMAARNWGMLRVILIQVLIFTAAAILAPLPQRQTPDLPSGLALMPSQKLKS
jgi:hypothetical protein